MKSVVMNQSALIAEPQCFEGEVELCSSAKDHWISDGINSIKEFYLLAILLLRPLLLAQGNGFGNSKHC